MSDSVSRPEAQPGDVILARECWIEGPNGDVSSLMLRFTRPVKRAVEGHEEFSEFVGTLHIECKHFTKVERLRGDDEIHVLCMLLWVGRILLENCEADGYSIWWREKGDLHYFDFWMGNRFQQDFCLPSARTAAKRKAFYETNAGRTLMPSHSVAIEPERPAVTIYRIHKDGSETLGNVIGPDEIRSQTMSGLAERIGMSVFYGSNEAAALIDQLKPDSESAPG
ncbi:MAG TPA: hypothetical protein VGM25_02130 [Caulobacteraceae bacterium]|jgi:hypothetical protein